MFRFAVGLPLLLLVSCGGSSPQEAVKDEVNVVAAAPVVAPPPPAPPVPEDAFAPTLLPEQLRGVLGVRDYQFRREGGVATLSFVLENLRANEALVLEMAARFENEKGEAITQTDWVRATIQPRRRHPYEASVRDTGAATGKILMRLVEKKQEP